MELNNYKSVTPLKKKRRKVTASATLVLCLLSLLIGLLCGKVSSNRQSEELISKQIGQIEFEHEIKVTQLETEITTRDDEINRLKKELADANSTVAANEQAPAVAEEDTDEPAAQKDDSVASEDKKASGGLGRILIIAVLIAIIAACIFFAVRIFLRRNDEYDEDDEYDDDEYYDDEDDDDEYYDDEEDDDEYYDEDEEDDEE